MQNQVGTQVQELLQKEMSRKEFLATIGFGVASVFGLSAVLKIAGVQAPHNIQKNGYGSSAYGGGSPQHNI